MKGIRYTTWGPHDGGCGHRHSDYGKAVECRERHDARSERANYAVPFSADRRVIEMSADSDLDLRYQELLSEYERRLPF